jgi:hypothetical protein
MSLKDVSERHCLKHQCHRSIHAINMIVSRTLVQGKYPFFFFSFFIQNIHIVLLITLLSLILRSTFCLLHFTIFICLFILLFIITQILIQFIKKRKWLRRQSQTQIQEKYLFSNQTLSSWSGSWI